jgi:hypothetical protein
MSENLKYLLLGIVLALAFVALLMPYMARGSSRWGPYYAHGGREYRPGVLY